MDESLLIETIRIQNGRVRHIKYHNERCNLSRKSLFGAKNTIDLRRYIDTSKASNPEVKCRITYDNKVRKVEYEAYTIRPITSLRYLEIGDYKYPHKFADRSQLKKFFNQRGKKDDILMIQNGLITDTYYANVALLKGEKWYTPKTPLLKGSCRARLLKEGKIIEANIRIDQLKDYEMISIFNAMISFKKLVISL